MTIPTTKMLQAWQGFTAGNWQTEVNTRDFIQTNYTPYEGDESFLADATLATTTLWNSVLIFLNNCCCRKFSDFSEPRFSKFFTYNSCTVSGCSR